MITPTARAIVLASLGAPLSLFLAGAANSNLWIVGALWAAIVALLAMLDGALAPAQLDVRVDAPDMAPIAAGPVQAHVALNWRGRAPVAAELALQLNRLLAAPLKLTRMPVEDRSAKFDIALEPKRRGEGVIEAAHLRWRGPMGLAWRAAIAPVERSIAITPDLQAVQRHAERLFSRTTLHGMKPLQDRGDGSEFDSLTDFHAGMDRRLVEWKRSATRARLLAKEVRIERNHQIALAIDCGRTMCEPIQNAPRLDWAVNASLLLAYVALRLGDKVCCFGFDARPRLVTGFVNGAHGFAQLLAQTARLDYSAEEANYTLSLTNLAERLQRRSLIVVFTEFSDTISAELMLENIGRLARRHVILFVTFPDQQLDTLRAAEPATADDVSRAVVAHRLLQEREIVLERLRRMGVYVVSSELETLGPSLVAAYDDVRRKERL